MENKPNTLKLTWREVFDVVKSTHIWHIDDAYRLTNQIGYHYFAWNGYVYLCEKHGYANLGIRVEDLL